MQTHSATDVYDQKTEGFIDPKVLKELSKLKVWRGLAQIALEWLYIAVAIMLCAHYWNPLLYIATVAWIGARQNGLGIMMHDATHYRLLPNRKWNDWIGEVFTAWPLMITMYGYRQTHFAHHQNVSTAKDPDRQRVLQRPKLYYPTTMGQFLLNTLKYWLGYYLPMELIGINQETKIPQRLQRLRLGFYAVMLAMSLVFHFFGGLVIYWFVPLSTYFLWVLYVRSISEHGIGSSDDLLSNTRHVEPNIIERWMIAPNNNYAHIAHHLYPSVPFYNLRRLHGVLLHHPGYAQCKNITKGYWRLVKQSLKSNREYFKQQS